MKEAVILVSFGTSYKEARERAIDSIALDIERTLGDMPVYQAFTSSIIIKKLKKQNINIYNIDEAVKKALDDNVRCLYAVTTHFIPGHEYNKLKGMLEKYKNAFDTLKISDPLLNNKADCKKIVNTLDKILNFEENKEYILMGHGTDAAADIMYHNVNSAFKEMGFDNVHIASVEGSIGIDEALGELNNRGKKPVVLHPFMVVAGDHAINDMAGMNDSFCSRLKDEGYEVFPIIKGLGEYEEFRKIYVDKLNEML